MKQVLTILVVALVLVITSSGAFAQRPGGHYVFQGFDWGGGYIDYSQSPPQLVPLQWVPIWIWVPSPPTSAPTQSNPDPTGLAMAGVGATAVIFYVKRRKRTATGVF